MTGFHQNEDTPYDTPTRLIHRSDPPEGGVRVHLYAFENVLRPRGSFLDKEGLGATILERMTSAYEHWTDPRYGDSIEDDAFACARIVEAARAACDAAIEQFERDLGYRD